MEAMKATAIAPSNLALIKYMGRKDDVLRLPANGSISMNLSGCLTTTTVEFSEEYAQDELRINGESEGKESARAFKHLDRIRALARIDLRARIESSNSFPRSTGLSSSSSGFAALTLASTSALELTLSPKELSILARQGSGSACRSIPDGFVEWKDGVTSEESYAESIFPPEHWDLCDVVAVVTYEKKKVTSTDTHVAVRQSPLFEPRIAAMPARIKECKRLLAARDLSKLGPLIEQESMDLHALYESVGIVQRSPEATQMMELVRQWRSEIPVYFSLNTGQNVHLICEAKDAGRVEEKLRSTSIVKDVIVNHPAPGARLVDQHLI
jgi:diphosphomevalonate decarboxylase